MGVGAAAAEPVGLLLPVPPRPRRRERRAARTAGGAGGSGTGAFGPTSHWRGDALAGGQLIDTITPEARGRTIPPPHLLRKQKRTNRTAIHQPRRTHKHPAPGTPVEFVDLICELALMHLQVRGAP